MGTWYAFGVRLKPPSAPPSYPSLDTPLVKELGSRIILVHETQLPLLTFFHTNLFMHMFMYIRYIIVFRFTLLFLNVFYVLLFVKRYYLT